MRLSILTGIVFLLVVSACKENNTQKEIIVENAATVSDHPYYVTNIEFAHEKDDFLKNELVCFNLSLNFKSSQRKMKVFTTTNSSSIRVDDINGNITILKDGKIFTNAPKKDWASERFKLYTYQYFFMLPYKLSEPGTKWQQYPAESMAGKMYNRSFLTFENGTGDSPDDWYMIHTDPENNLIMYAGYIVTAGGRSVEDAEKSAHAMQYTNYKNVKGFPIAHEWNIFDYAIEGGIGDQIGSGKVVNVEFMDVVDQFDITSEPEFQEIAL